MLAQSQLEEGLWGVARRCNVQRDCGAVELSGCVNREASGGAVELSGCDICEVLSETLKR